MKQTRKRNFPLIRNRNTVIRSWLIPYLLIFVLILSVFSFMYRQVITYAEDELRSTYQGSLNQIQLVLDQAFSETKRIALVLSRDDSIHTLTFAPELTYEEHYSFYVIQKKLCNYSIANKDIDEISVIYKDIRAVITNKAPFEINDFFHTRMHCTGEAFSRSHTMTESISVLEGRPEGPALVYCLQLPLEPRSIQNAMITVQLSDSLLQWITRQLDGKILEICLGDQVLRLNYAEDPALLLNSRNYHLLEASSSAFGLHYKMYVATSEFERTLQTVNIISFVCIILAVILFCIILYFSIHYNYTPIQKLMREAHLIAAEPKSPSTNELDYIHSALLSVQKQNQILERSINRSMDAKRRNDLMRLLTGKTSQAEYQQISSQFMSKSGGQNCIVVCCCPISYQDLFSQHLDEANSSENFYLLHYIIENILRDYRSDTLSPHSAIIEGCYYFLISGSSESIRFISEFLRELPQLLHNTFNADVALGLSSPYSSLDALRKMHQEAELAVDHSVLFDVPFTEYQEIRDSEQGKLSSSAGLFRQSAEALRSALFSGDTDAAGEHLELAFRLLRSGELPLAQIKLYSKYLANSFLEGIAAFKARHSSFSMNTQGLDKTLYRRQSIRLLQGKMTEVLQSFRLAVSDCIHLEKENLQQELCQYIKDNYADPNLNVSTTADAFDMSVSTLSQSFKRMTGVTLLAYITQIRIDEAKKLLQNSSLSVTEIAERVGYNDVSTFIRNFKRREGTSPKKYLKESQPFPSSDGKAED